MYLNFDKIISDKGMPNPDPDSIKRDGTLIDSCTRPKRRTPGSEHLAKADPGK